MGRSEPPIADSTVDWRHYVLRGHEDHSNCDDCHSGDVYYPTSFHLTCVYRPRAFHNLIISHSDGGGHSDGDNSKVHQCPEGGSSGDRIVAANRR